MNNIKRLCRVCMTIGNLIPIFKTDSNAQTSQDIKIITGIQIVDYPNIPAFICIKCMDDLNACLTFRIKCRNTDQFIRESLVNFGNGGDLDSNKMTNYNGFEIKDEQNMLDSIKSEPLEVESFFDYPINAEAILNENSDWINENQIEGEERNAVYEFTNNNSKGKRKNEYKRKFIEQITCEICGKQYNSKSKYNRHYRVEHLGEKEKQKSITGCHYCMKTFDSKTQLKDHIRYKHEVYDFKCDACDKDFSVKNKLAKHYREFHMKTKSLKKSRVKKEPKETQCFPCIVCGKICHSTTFLRVHEKSHIKIKPEDYYYCDLCGNKFRTKNPLQLHITTRHILKLRYTCEKCPGKSWARKDHMKRHVKVVHENIRDFKCEWCSKCFPEKRKLECHIRIHTGEQPFCCSFCGKKYTHETDYRRHIWSHTGARKYKCTSCRIAFNKRSELIAHRSECVYYNYNHNNINI